MRKSIRSPGVASGLIEVEGFLSNKTSPANVTTLSSALSGILSYKISGVTTTFDESPDLRFEHVAG